MALAVARSRSLRRSLIAISTEFSDTDAVLAVLSDNSSSSSQLLLPLLLLSPLELLAPIPSKPLMAPPLVCVC